MHRFVAGNLFVGTIGIFACGGGGGDAGGSITSVPEGRELAALAPAEAQTVCADAIAYLRARITPEQSKAIGCQIGARVSAAFAKAFKQDERAACQSSFDECMAKPAAPDEGDTSDGTVTGESCELARCAPGVTVADYVACVRASVDRLSTARFSCEAGEEAPAPSCARVQSACGREER